MNHEDRLLETGIDERLYNVLWASFRDSHQVNSFIELIEVQASSYLLKHLDALAIDLHEEEQKPPVFQEESKTDLASEKAFALFKSRYAEMKPKFARRQQVLDSCAELPKCFGTIWRLSKSVETLVPACPVPDAVLLISTPQDDDLTVQTVPVHSWTAFTMPGDLAFPSCDYHTKLIVPLWNEQPVALSRLDACTGRLLSTELDSVADALVSKKSAQEPVFFPEHYRAFQEFCILCTGPLRNEALAMLQEQQTETQVLFNVLIMKQIFDRKRKALGDKYPVGITEGLAARGDIEAPIYGVELYSEEHEYCFYLSPLAEDKWELKLTIGSNEELEGAAILAKDHGELATMVQGKAVFTLGSATEICLRLTDGAWVEAKISDA